MVVVVVVEFRQFWVMSAVSFYAVNSLPFCCGCEAFCTVSGSELSCHSSRIGVWVRLEKKDLKLEI